MVDTGNGHTPYNTHVALIDRRARVLWTNQFPDVEDVWYYGEPIFDHTHPDDIADVEDALAKCIIRGQMVDVSLRVLFAEEPHKRGEKYVQLSARFYPADIEATPHIAAVVVSHTVPDGVDFNDSDRAVLQGLMNDQTIKQIADSLAKSQSTIESRIKNLKDKLGVETLPGLVASAMRSYLL